MTNRRVGRRRESRSRLSTLVLTGLLLGSLSLGACSVLPTKPGTKADNSAQPTSAPSATGSAEGTPEDAKFLQWTEANDTAGQLGGDLTVNTPYINEKTINAPLKTGGIIYPEGWQPMVMAPTVMVLLSSDSTHLLGVSLEDGSELWRYDTKASWPIREVTVFDGKVVTSTGHVVDLNTGEAASLPGITFPPDTEVHLHTSRDQKSLFISIPLEKGFQNYVLRVAMPKPVLEFKSEEYRYLQLPSSQIYIGGVVYDPKTNRVARVPKFAGVSVNLEATADGVIKIDDAPTVQTTHENLLYPWTDLQAPAEEAKPSKIETRGRCLLAQLDPTPSMQAFMDFCGPKATIPAMENKEVHALKGIAGASGRMWSFSEGQAPRATTRLTADLKLPGGMVIDNFELIGPDMIMATRTHKGPDKPLGMSIIILNTGGKILDLYAIEQDYRVLVKGALGEQRYLCTTKLDKEGGGVTGGGNCFKLPR
ncbi:hypothetical protein BSR29_07335 [Boudabousia liubingyangii]|uniref:Uncharacterized protein n=1 Tax=Boudabousia liubingyangii TaxID=1921764 RepID=A0A1Q5PK71_9ACTO|nr:hypothetical protein [Boudabousia liubingyangii]OKL46625.1 hypothetical protein BSR29_07335 [Boudabousia liubingyangii]